MERFGIRAIAALEAAKGLLILTVGFGLLALLHKDAEALTASLVRHLHINPASKYPQIFIKASRHVTDSGLLALAALAFFDAVIRLVQAIGLWLDRIWGKWLGIVSGSVYVPFEIYELAKHATLLKFATLTLNIGIVIYLAWSIRAKK